MVPIGVADVAPWTDWPSVAEWTLRFLHGYAGWDVWVVTRVEGDQHARAVDDPG